jgi:hypothetical protein
MSVIAMHWRIAPRPPVMNGPQLIEASRGERRRNRLDGDQIGAAPRCDFSSKGGGIVVDGDRASSCIAEWLEPHSATRPSRPSHGDADTSNRRGRRITRPAIDFSSDRLCTPGSAAAACAASTARMGQGAYCTLGEPTISKGVGRLYEGIGRKEPLVGVLGPRWRELRTFTLGRPYQSAARLICRLARGSPRAILQISYQRLRARNEYGARCYGRGIDHFCGESIVIVAI